MAHSAVPVEIQDMEDKDPGEKAPEQVEKQAELERGGGEGPRGAQDVKRQVREAKTELGQSTEQSQSES